MSRFRLAPDCTGLSVDGLNFEAQKAEHVVNGQRETVVSARVPDALDGKMLKMGFVKFHQEPGPPLDAAGLRTDGPTLEAYVAAGYSAEDYPPQGYASKEKPADLAKAKAETKKAREAKEKAEADARDKLETESKALKAK